MFHFPHFRGEGAYFFRVGDYMFVPLSIHKNKSSLGTEPMCYLTVFSECWWVSGKAFVLGRWIRLTPLTGISTGSYSVSCHKS